MITDDMIKAGARALAESWGKLPDLRTKSGHAEWEFHEDHARACIEAVLLVASGWQPIETAPRDGTIIDLWLVSNGNPGGFRVTDCRRSYDAGKWPDVWVRNGSRFVNLSWYYHDGDYCLLPGNDPHPEAFAWTRATHWMPRPAAPLSQRQE